ncbi:hypothetical protein HC928_08010 [bacterium]|nr:hypothetical protein [bacterium]
MSELSFSLSTASAEALTYDVSGMGKPWTFFGAANPPLRIRPRVHPLFVGTFVEAWLDPSANEIGTTSIGSRLANVEHSITTGVTTKFLPQGLESNRGYTRTGRTKREFTTSFSLEHTSNSEINYYSNNTTVRLRVRYNSANLIKTGFPYYVQFDVVGKLHTFEWGELEGSNRTVDFEIIPMFTPGTEYSWAVEVQTGVTPPRLLMWHLIAEN